MFSPYSQIDHRHKDASSPTNIEPMSLGSPVSSPKGRTSVNQNFLPPYLFGEPTTPPVATSPWNTPKQSNTSVFQSPAATMINPVLTYREQHAMYPSPASNSLISTPSAAKSGGPPTQGLLYSTSNNNISLDHTQLHSTSIADRLGSDHHNFSNIQTPNKSFSTANTSYLSPAQIDPFYTQGEALKDSDQLDESWVTVFGFPAASVNYILQQFSQYGTIVENKIEPSGNWMHLRYQSKLQAKKALSKNGKIFSGNIMIGVKPCIEMDLMNSCRETSIRDTSLNPALQTSSMPSTPQADPADSMKPNLKNIRPLTQAYQSPNTQVQATTRTTGIISKAFDYIWKIQ